ncbi:biopolymer transporter ExbD [Kiloniella sp. EL199]|uniref:ExbD/TolR family protein n=1 Tax=Kiloniella sp. EL199 TaxID=2107581 RepID=UPI000EA36746|nr:biopolymer transporter ExbD [Kiloniella sp. EL199]
MQVKRQGSSTAHIGLTPLIDVVFILLIFFMVATSFDMPRLLSLKPATGGKGSISERPVVRITVGSNGGCYLDEAFHDCNEIGSIIHGQGQGDVLPVVALTPRAGTKLQDIIGTVDALALSGLNDTVLMPSSDQIQDNRQDLTGAKE